MENIKIAAAFVKAKRAFSPALKDKTNPAFRSKYADLGACLEAVNDALLDNGIAVLQETFMDESGVTVETVLLHESGEMIRGGKLHLPATKQDAQGFGSALTYARRYSLQATCGIAPEDDDGNSAVKAKPAKQAPIDLTPYFAAMDAAKSSKELGAAAKAAWEATGDDRITDYHTKVLNERKAAAKAAAAYAQQAETAEEKKLRELAEATNG